MMKFEPEDGGSTASETLVFNHQNTRATTEKTANSMGQFHLSS